MIHDHSIALGNDRFVYELLSISHPSTCRPVFIIMSTVGVPGTLLPGRTIAAVLLDITGVLYESGDGGGKVIQGSPEAVSR